MCCHSYATQTAFTAKDFIVPVFTVLMGFVLVSVQINKNRKSKWVEDFRREGANLLALFMKLKNAVDVAKIKDPDGEPENILAMFHEIQQSAYLVQLFLDRKTSSHIDLSAHIDEMAKRITKRQFKDKEFYEPMKQISDAIHNIIRKTDEDLTKKWF